MKKAIRLTFLFALLITTVMMPQMSLYASAASSSEYVKVTKNDSFSKDGKYYMSFTIENLQKPVDIGGLNIGEQLLVDVSITNSAGKRITSWNTLSITAGQKKSYNFGTDYSSLPSGTYILTLKVSAILASESWKWTYKINHKAPEASMSFKSYETYFDDNSNYMHKFKIQCCNMKGKELTFKAYNAKGDLVCTIPGVKRASNNETAWFAWNGYNNGVKLASGNYTIVITGGGKTIRKTYKLEILERAEG